MRPYYLVSEDEVCEELKTSQKGLSTVEAQERLRIYGPNKIREQKRASPFLIFLAQFKSPIVWVLLVAMGVAFAANELVDLYAILVIVILNAVLGFVQEFRAERAIEALKKLVSLKAVVLRDGVEREIDAEEVVPGDVLVVSTGVKVAADARVVSGSVEMQESQLTGESVPVRKHVGVIEREVAIADRSNMVFASTMVTSGRSLAVVVGTGMGSEIGKIAALLEDVLPQETVLQRRLKKLSGVIGIGVVVIAVIVFVVGLFRLHQGVSSVLLTAIALAVAAIPEGLPAVVTVSLSLGVQRLAKKNALMRHLPSVETLGSCTVICADKTGTLTQNEMTVRKLFVNRQVVEIAGVGYSSEGYFSADAKHFELLLQMGALNNNAQLQREGGVWKVIGDPTEAALLVSAQKGGLDLAHLKERFPKVMELEFTSERKCMTTVHKTKKGRVAFTKGAPEVILSNCAKILVNGRVERLDRKEKEQIERQVEVFAKSAFRVLGFAYKELGAHDGKSHVEKDLVFVGLQAMIDPPRPDVAGAIEKCKTAGIKVVMITGDHALTAQAVAKDLGLVGKVVTGVELDEMKDLSSQVEQIAVFARVNPAHKLKIVNAFKALGHTVAMTGDGVNDAPALKKADIGIAMGLTGTDVAKEASVMVLADDNFSTIVRAVEEGRRIFDNIQKYIAYLFSGNIGEVCVIVGAMVLGLGLPLVALQILWVNLVTDGLPALALSVDPAEPDVMRRSPRRSNNSIFKGIEPYVTIYPLLLTVGTLWLFDAYQGQGLPKAQTMAFTSLVMFQMFQAISVRSVTKPVFAAGVFANRYLYLAIFSSIVLQVLIVNVGFLQKIFGVVALSASEWGLIVLFSLSGFVYLELHKLLFKRSLT